MIEINERFSIDRDKYQWILDDYGTPRYNEKTGNLVRSANRTYYGSLEQVANKILDRLSGECESLEEIVCLLKLAQTSLLSEIKERVNHG